MSLQSTIKELAPNQQRFLLRKIAESIIRHHNEKKQAEIKQKEREKKLQQEQLQVNQLKQELESLFDQKPTS